jgi:hypothetical protein
VGNPADTKEGAKGQRVYASRSTDGGTKWSPRFEIFQSTLETAQPKSPVHSEWQPRAARIETPRGPEIWLAYSQGRGQSDQGAFMAIRRGPQDKYTRYRLVQDQRDGSIKQVQAAEAEREASRYAVIWRIDGDDWFPFPQSMRQLPDGAVLMTLTLIESKRPFAEASKRFAVARFSDNQWSLSGLAPTGDMDRVDAWESSLYQHPDGRLTAYIRSSDIKKQRGKRLAYSDSFDGGRTWSACKWTLLPIHTEQPSIAQLPGGMGVLTMPDHTTHRNNRALILIAGDNVTLALPVSEEAEGVSFAHTSDVTFDAPRRRLLVVWSEGKVGQTPNSIHFRHIDSLPSMDSLNLLPRRNAEYELNDSSQRAEWVQASSRLVLHGRASAGLQLPAKRSSLQFPLDLTDAADGAVVAVLGDRFRNVVWQYDKARSRIALVEVSGADRDRAENEVAAVSVPSGKAAQAGLSLIWDPVSKTVVSAGRTITLTAPMPTFFLGDGFLGSNSKSTSTVRIGIPATVGFVCKETQGNSPQCTHAK